MCSSKLIVPFVLFCPLIGVANGAWTIDTPTLGEDLGQSVGFSGSGFAETDGFGFSAALEGGGERYDIVNGVSEGTGNHWSATHEPILECPIGDCAYVLRLSGDVHRATSVDVVQ
jgi:hypothetical protein